MISKRSFISNCLLAFAALFFILPSLSAQLLYQFPAGVETRWASPENPKGERGKGAQANAGRKGRQSISIEPGERAVLAEVSGSSGVIHRIWATINDRSPRMLRGLRFEIFWDGAARPAVSAPFGDFFGMGLGRMTAFQSALFSSPEGKSFNCFIPMPFRKGMKIVVTNESGRRLDALYYDVDYTLGDKLDSGVLYLHAYYRRENPTSVQKDYQILPRISGRGRFLGACIGVKADQKKYGNLWWGEGEVKVFLDGDGQYPTLSGTGTEDYIGDGWGQNQFSNLYTGSHYADSVNMRYCFYRYHVPDPIYFRREIRVTIQQIGYYNADPGTDSIFRTGAPIYKAGPGLAPKEKDRGGLFERRDDWSSCAYFYLNKPENDLPPIDRAALRIKGID